jgi:hypothetical protein
MPAFARHIGIDYSGAETPTASLKGLRVYLAEHDALQRRHSATVLGGSHPIPGSTSIAPAWPWAVSAASAALVAETLPAMREGSRHHP